MTFKRFKQLWNALITDRAKRPITDKTIVMKGSSKQTTDSLIKCSYGDFSDFDRIDANLKLYDRLEKERANLRKQIAIDCGKTV